MRAVVALSLAALCLGCGPGDSPRGPGEDADIGGSTSDRSILLDPSHPAWLEASPDTFSARFETTEGEFVIRVIRAWAPIGADRFFNLIRHGYYDDSRFYRTVPGFIAQWGLSGDQEVTRTWLNETIPDDSLVVGSNVRGAVAFAFTEADTRSTQVFINLVDNTRLDAQGFPPFGTVVEGMDVVDRLYGEYGENSGGGMRRGEQDGIITEGNAFLDREYPELDRLIRATVEEL